MDAISVRNLCKRFRIYAASSANERKRGVRRRRRTVEALDDVSFDIAPGELVGYIGPNGAGKSTTVKILSGILVPDSGSVTVGGLVPWKRRIEHVARIGVVFGQRTQLWWDLPVIESYSLLRHIYRVPEQLFRDSLDRMTGLLGLEPLLGVPVRQLSLGQRMRCEIAASLLHSPRILFLDEPTIGLDAEAKLAVRDFIRTINVEQGITVILTTHDLDDIEQLCSRVMVIGHGRLISDGPLSALRERVNRERRLTVDLADDRAVIAIPGVRVLSHDGSHQVLGFDPATIPAHRLIAEISSRHRVLDLTVEYPPIEEIVADYYASAANRFDSSEAQTPDSDG